jgi:hypothetical protein
MAHIRTDSQKRYHYASLICDYLLKKNITHAVVTARDIAKFHHLSGKSSQSISAMLNFLYSNRIRESRFGFYILGTLAFKKVDYPHRYTIELIDGARSHDRGTFPAVMASCIPDFPVKIFGRFIDYRVFREAGRTGEPDNVSGSCSHNLLF